MARITVTELKHACLDPEWLQRWIADPTISVPPPHWNAAGFAQAAAENGAGVPGSLFHQIVAEFTDWLTSMANRKTSAKIKSSAELWDALWNRTARNELLQLARSGLVPEADRLSQALQNWCEHLSTLRGKQKSWSEILLTAEYQFGDAGVPTESGKVIVAGRPDAVRLETTGLVAVDYKLSRGRNLDADFLQAIIYARLLQLTHPELEFAAQLEYYEPERHILRQDPVQVEASFQQLVLPTLEEIAKAKGRPNPPTDSDLGPAIADAYKSYGIDVTVTARRDAPQLVRYLIQPAPGVSFAQIERRATDLKLALRLPTAPVIRAGPGDIWFDVAKDRPDTVYWREAIARPEINDHPSPLAFLIGVEVTGELAIGDFTNPNSAHLLVAGSSGSGKSEFLKSLIATLAVRSSPARMKFSLIDPKRVTFGGAQNSPFLFGPVLFELEESLTCLAHAADEMDQRYDFLQSKGLSNVSELPLEEKEAHPYRVIVFDEFADLINSGKKERNEFERLVKKIAAKGRAAGFHLVIATQRPDRDIVTGQIKANLPLRICLRVVNAVNAKLVLDETGAENLLGRGDLLWTAGRDPQRAQSPFATAEEFQSALGAKP